MDNPGAGPSLPIKLAHMDFRKFFNLIAFDQSDQPVTIIEETHAMPLNRSDDVLKTFHGQQLKKKNGHLRIH